MLRDLRILMVVSRLRLLSLLLHTWAFLNQMEHPGTNTTSTMSETRTWLTSVRDVILDLIAKIISFIAVKTASKL